MASSKYSYQQMVEPSVARKADAASLTVRDISWSARNISCRLKKLRSRAA